MNRLLFPATNSRELCVTISGMPNSSGTISIRVRYHECDPMGVAHHAVYPVWFEMGRTELLRQTFAHDSGGGLDYRQLEAQGILLAVVSLSIKYKKPAKYDDVLSLTTTLSAAGHVKIEHEYVLSRDRLILATGHSTLACLDAQGRPRELPPLLRSMPAID
jgi:acyl-CoA thioester hydrolase